MAGTTNPSENAVVPPRPEPRPLSRAKPRTNTSTVIAVILAAVLIVLTTILVLNHGTLAFGQTSGNPTLVFVDGIDRNITYLGGLPQYFGPTTNDSCPYCPVGAEAGGALRIPLARWYPPRNLSFWVFTNVSGPFLVQGPSCSPAPCTLPWIRVWSFETYVPADTLASMTLFATFQLPNHENWPNIVTLNATFCPSWVCTEVPPS